MRYRTAAISCFALVGGMFALPALIWRAFLPSLKQAFDQGLSDPPIPGYERILLDTADFCGDWKWLVALPILSLGLLFTVKALTAPGTALGEFQSGRR